MGRGQCAVVRAGLRGEEKAYFAEVLARVARTFDTMPTTGETDGQGEDAVAHLHYFTGAADFWIVERDAGSPDDEPGTGQIQAFGLADLYGDGGELGYISIPELLENGAELDFHFKPKTLREIRAKQAARCGVTA